jgi:hypothetical protein
MQRITAKSVENYLRTTYGECRHNPDALAKASRATAKAVGCSPIEMFKFMVDDEPIGGIYTHSYGFHTREGRAIRGIFEENYYSCLNQC